LVAFVQSANSVPVEYLFIDFQTGVRKKFRWELFDAKRMASAALANRPYPRGEASPVPSPWREPTFTSLLVGNSSATVL